MIAIVRDTTRNVTGGDGKMIKRWFAVWMLNAEHSVRRRKGFRQMPTFVAALAVASKPLHRRAMLQESHERTNGRPTARWS
jgi:hypothetical protein